ncbi:MAG: Mrp/NBP35 family ATP-binding protein [Propionibacteriaceae bacterium]|nr:Mrp/NBP35 family ATP-binding protein [Propionibacteriaceae bacterium]
MNETHPLYKDVVNALNTVMDPELGRSITELKMVESIDIDDDSRVKVHILLTTPACPLKARFTSDVTEAVGAIDGVSGVEVTMGAMNPEQRDSLRNRLQGIPNDIPFAREDNLTQVIAIASGKGGVGKSSLTVNLACALAEQGFNVGLIDADIYGHSVPDLMGIAEDDGPTSIEGMELILPVEAHGIKMMSIGMMKPSRDQVVAWRGPVVDRAVSQFLSEVFWGDLDFLLIDLPPGTGDIAIGLGQKLPNAEVIVVTTPQHAATEVAERAGTMAAMLTQRVIGVVENMSYLETTCPHCSKSHRVDVFGSGGGSLIAANLSSRLGYDVPLLAEIPLEPQVRMAGDEGKPFVIQDRSHPAAQAVWALAQRLGTRKRNLAGTRLKLDLN